MSATHIYIVIAGGFFTTRVTVAGRINMVCVVGAIARNILVTLRRGIRGSEGCTHTLCPDVRVYSCVSSLRVVMLRVVVSARR